MDAREQLLKGLKGLVQIRFSSPEKKFIGQQVLLVRRPGYLRVESLSPLGNPIFYLVTDGSEMTLYDPGENRYYHGPFTATSLSSSLPVDLNPEEIVAFLLGGLPRKAYEKLSVRAEPKEGLWVMDLVSPSRTERQTLWVHPQTLHILRAEFHRPGVSYHLAFSDFRRLQGVMFPRHMQLTSPPKKLQISMEFQETELNPEWNAQDFHLSVPKGATVIPGLQ